jgi:hypothetical protein
MAPTHATKAGIRYRYYVPLPCLHGEGSAGAYRRGPEGFVRGFMARDMDDKWLIHMDCRNHLLFRRSWTGNLIYDVETEWLGDRIRLRTMMINRDESQYDSHATDDEEIGSMLALIDILILRRSKDANSIWE